MSIQKKEVVGDRFSSRFSSHYSKSAISSGNLSPKCESNSAVVSPPLAHIQPYNRSSPTQRCFLTNFPSCLDWFSIPNTSSSEELPKGSSRHTTTHYTHKSGAVALIFLAHLEQYHCRVLRLNQSASSRLQTPRLHCITVTPQECRRYGRLAYGGQPVPNPRCCPRSYQPRLLPRNRRADNTRPRRRECRQDWRE